MHLIAFYGCILHQHTLFLIRKNSKPIISRLQKVRNAFFRQRVPGSIQAWKETVDINYLVATKNGARKMKNVSSLVLIITNTLTFFPIICYIAHQKASIFVIISGSFNGHFNFQSVILGGPGKGLPFTERLFFCVNSFL